MNYDYNVSWIVGLMPVTWSDEALSSRAAGELASRINKEFPGLNAQVFKL